MFHGTLLESVGVQTRRLKLCKEVSDNGVRHHHALHKPELHANARLKHATQQHPYHDNKDSLIALASKQKTLGNSSDIFFDTCFTSIASQS